MRELPAKSNGVVRVESQQGSQPSTARSASNVHASRAEFAHVRSPLKLLRFPAVRERTGLSRSTIWRLERRGAFPQHHRISPNVVAWVEEDVTSWIELKRGSVA